jgi:hypothetical protein
LDEGLTMHPDDLPTTPVPQPHVSAADGPDVIHLAPAATQSEIRLVTVEGSTYGPYVGAPGNGHGAPYDGIRFTRATAQQIVLDLNGDACGMTGHFTRTGTLVLEWHTDFDGTGGRRSIRPDTTGRYRIGDLWAWENWADEPWSTHAQQVYAEGARQFQGTVTNHHGSDWIETYDAGREEADRVTLRRYEP